MGLGPLLSFVVLLFAQSDPAVAAFKKTLSCDSRGTCTDTQKKKVQALAKLAGRGGQADEENNHADIDQTGFESPPKDCTKESSRVKKRTCELNQAAAQNELAKQNNYRKPKMTEAERAAQRKAAGKGRVKDATQTCEQVFDKPCWDEGLKTGYCKTWCLAQEYSKRLSPEENEKQCERRCPEICTYSRTNVWRNHGEDAKLIAATKTNDLKAKKLAEAALRKSGTQIHFLQIEAMLREHLVKCICVHRQLDPEDDQSGCHQGGQGLAPNQKWCEWGLEQDEERMPPSWRTPSIIADYKTNMNVNEWCAPDADDEDKKTCSEWPGLKAAYDESCSAIEAAEKAAAVA